MINKIVYSITCAILVWVLGVSCYYLSSFLTILENTELQSNIVLVLAIVPCASIGTYLFYKKSFIKPSVLALIFIGVSIVLDALVTVPMFIIPNGGSFSEFFGDAIFYTLVVEFYFIVLYYGNYLTQKVKA
ncbi:hypothetical protein [Urechidicola sp. KH5]